MMRDGRCRNEHGIALVVVLLVLVAVAAVMTGAAVVGSGASLITKYHERLSALEAAADAGLELARSAINGDKTLYPQSGYATLESGAAVHAADGSTIPDIKRWLYVGPTGVTSGQYGVFGSVVSVVEDLQGNRVVRRNDIFQASFAQYAYFTDVEGNVNFGAGNQIFGPLHTNDDINIGHGNPRPTFWGPVVTAGRINNRSDGVFRQGYVEHGPTIPMPTITDLARLEAQALYGNTRITGSTAGNDGQATTRIEFVAVDLNTDGDSSDANEGFFRVYQAPASNIWWVVADTNNWWGNGPNNGIRNSPNCGHWVAGGTTYHGPEFTTFAEHTTTSGGDQDRKQNAPAMSGSGVIRRCFLGGSDVLNADSDSANGRFVADDGLGAWQPWPGAVSPLLTGRSDAAYLWPLSRELNPDFKGVIYVEGKVAVSGRLRGQVTVVSPNTIVIVDDVTYVTNPATPGRNCRDMLGLFSGQDVIIADNLIQDPIPHSQGAPWVTWDETPDEFVHAVVLALNSFAVENWNQGPGNAERCRGVMRGRGCLYLIGGIIQRERGPMGSASQGWGHLKQYSYDACGAESPPPYFPTTGRFSRGHYFEVEPTGFDINAYWDLLQ